MKQKAFTLIELLVVVAIIGILAAVGVVAYNGYTGAAKASVAKANHKTVVKFISSSLMQCSLGEELKLKTWSTWGNFYDTQNLCNQSNSIIASGFVAHFMAIGFRNPYASTNQVQNPVFEKNSTNCNNVGLGYVCIIVNDSAVKVVTEWKSNEYLQDEFQRE